MGLIYAVFMSVGWLLIRVPRRRLEARGLGPGAGRDRLAGHHRERLGAQRDQDPAVLAAVGGAVLQRHRRASASWRRPRRSTRDFFRDATSRRSLAAAAAGFVAMLSLANMLGRFVWSSTSDFIGRKNMYRIYLGVGALLYLVHHAARRTPTRSLFLLVRDGDPVVLRRRVRHRPGLPADLFGTYQVGAIHGRLLTAWSDGRGARAADRQRDRRRAGRGRQTGPGRYTLSFSIMIGLLVVGFVCNELIRPVERAVTTSRPPTRGARTGAEAKAG